MLRVFLIGVLAVMLTACSKNVQPTAEKGAYYEFTDSAQHTVTLKEQPKKVVSLMGSYAEMWILAGGSLAGVTEDAVSERKLSLSDDVEVIGTVKDPSLEKILSLEPDFILLSTDIESHTKLLETFNTAGVTCAFFKEDSYLDYLSMLKIFTEITGREDLYKKFGESVNSQIKGIMDSLPKTGEKPKVLLIRSMATKARALKEDHLVGIMLKDLNTDNIASRHESLLEDLSMETIIDEDPDFIFVVTMGDVGKAMETLEKGIMSNPAWNNLSAVKNNHYYVLPKDLFQYKPNARWGESYEYLEKILYR